MATERNGRGRPRKYLTIKEWKAWLGNDWKHHRWLVKTVFVMQLGILAAVVASLITG